MSLPRRKLCGANAHRQQGQFSNMVEHGLAKTYQGMCPLEMVPMMTEAEWLALMSPPPVTDEMVERAARKMSLLVRYTVSTATVRAVLEAALNPKEANDA